MSAVSLSVPGIFHPMAAGSPCMDATKKIFERVLVPLYGPQEKALQQIARGEDRTGFLLYKDNNPLGVIVFKTVLSDEFREYGIKKSVEIKSLFVVDSDNNSGRGLGSALLNKVIEETQLRHLRPESFHVTVSNTKQDSLIFFLKKGFDIKHAWMGKYTPNIPEYLLVLPARVDAVAQSVLPLSPQVYHQVARAHWGDIHGLHRLSDSTFVTISKDRSIYLRDSEGNVVRAMREVEPRETDTEEWTTAIGGLNGDYFATGERSGQVYLWNAAGEYVKPLSIRLPKAAHYSKKENQRRICCIAPSLDPSRPGLFVGLPTGFAEYNAIEGRSVSFTKAHSNDWVYRVHPLDKDRLLTVVGASVELWQKQAARWEKKKTVLAEEKKRSKQRAFISDLTRLSETQVAVGSFQGQVQVVDLPQSKVVFSAKQHQGRIWALAPLGSHSFASGGDDGIVRLWDIRSQASSHSLPQGKDSVSALLRLNEHALIAGSCPVDPIRNEGASLTFYDIRK